MMSPVVAEFVVKTDPSHQLCPTLTVKVKLNKFDHWLPVEI